MANTPFLNLVKPTDTDQALITDINNNSDKIDTGVSTLSEQITTKYAKFDIENESIVSSDVHSLGQGNYRMNGGAANLPVAVAGVATVIYRNSNTKWLTYRTDDGRIYEQMCASGTWTAWKQLSPNISNINYGSAQSPVTNLDNIANNTSGNIVIAAAISPISGSVVSGSYWKTSYDNTQDSYSIIFVRQYSNDMFFYSKAAGTVKGWKQLESKSDFAKTNLQSVSVYSSRSEGLAGGYIKVGNIVYVSIIGKVTTNISNNDLIISGLPKPNSTNLPLAGQNDSTKTILRAVVNQNGGIAVGAMSANEYFTIAGSYVSLE